MELYILNVNIIYSNYIKGIESIKILKVTTLLF